MWVGLQQKRNLSSWNGPVRRSENCKGWWQHEMVEC